MGTAARHKRVGLLPLEGAHYLKCSAEDVRIAPAPLDAHRRQACRVGEFGVRG